MTTETIFLFLLVGGGAFLCGIGNVLTKYYLSEKNVHEDVMVVGTMAGAVVSAVVVQFAWNGIPKISSGFWIPFAVTAALNVVMANLAVRSNKLEDVSIVVPLASTMPAWAIAGTWILLHEWPNQFQRLGIVAIAFGAYILGLKGIKVEMPGLLSRVIPQRHHERFLFFTAPWLRLFYSRGARFALLQAWLGAFAISFDKLATLNSSPMIFSAGAYLVVAITTYGYSKTSGRWKQADKNLFKAVFMLGLLVGVYTVLVNAGYYFSLAANIGSLKRLQIFFTAVFAWWFLREKNAPLRITGSVIIFLGALLIALGEE